MRQVRHVREVERAYRGHASIPKRMFKDAPCPCPKTFHAQRLSHSQVVGYQRNNNYALVNTSVCCLWHCQSIYSTPVNISINVRHSLSLLERSCIQNYPKKKYGDQPPLVLEGCTILKKTNKQTNKQTNKTKQNKTKNKLLGPCWMFNFHKASKLLSKINQWNVILILGTRKLL